MIESKTTINKQNLLSIPNSKNEVNVPKESSIFDEMMKDFDKVTASCNEEIFKAKKKSYPNNCEADSIELIQQQIKVIQEVNQRIKYYMSEINKHTVRASK